MGVAPAEVEQPVTGQDAALDAPWVTVVWNDPVNLMTYVTYVFQKVFGYPKAEGGEAHAGRASQGQGGGPSGAREAMERDAETLHGYGLWATVSHDS